jgi:hypothetical protein
MTHYFISLFGPICSQLIDFLSIVFLPDSVEPLTTTQLRGNCTICMDQAILRGPGHFQSGATAAWDLGNFPTRRSSSIRNAVAGSWFF